MADYKGLRSLCIFYVCKYLSDLEFLLNSICNVINLLENLCPVRPNSFICDQSKLIKIFCSPQSHVTRHYAWAQPALAATGNLTARQSSPGAFSAPPTSATQPPRRAGAPPTMLPPPPSAPPLSSCSSASAAGTRNQLLLHGSRPQLLFKFCHAEADFPHFLCSVCCRGGEAAPARYSDAGRPTPPALRAACERGETVEPAPLRPPRGQPNPSRTT